MLNSLPPPSERQNGHNGMYHKIAGSNINFINIPKNGSTSVRESVNFENFNFYKDINSNPIVAIVRNPKNRLVSAFFEILRKENRNNSPLITQIKSKNDIVARFLELVRLIEDEGFFEEHLCQQVFYLYNFNLNKYIEIDNIFLLNDINSFFNFIGIKKKKHSRATKNIKDKNRLINYIDEDIDLKKRIEEIYRQDFLLYNLTSKEK